VLIKYKVNVKSLWFKRRITYNADSLYIYSISVPLFRHSTHFDGTSRLALVYRRCNNGHLTNIAIIRVLCPRSTSGHWVARSYGCWRRGHQVTFTTCYHLVPPPGFDPRPHRHQNPKTTNSCFTKWAYQADGYLCFIFNVHNSVCAQNDLWYVVFFYLNLPQRMNANGHILVNYLVTE